MSNLARAALWYARAGWRVFPCVARKKLPAIEGWQKLATTDQRQIEAWWSVRPDSNIGVACGPGSGVYVLDVDQHGDDGEVALRACCRRLGALPATVEQRTGSGGRQLFFVYPDGRICRNTAGAKRGLGAGLDTRGDGGFVVVPPSIHPCGDPYAWTTGPHQAALAELPERWIARVERKPEITVSVPVPRFRTIDAIGRDVIERKANAIARMGKGSRNDELYRGAFYLAKLAESGMVEWPDAAAALAWAGQACGLDAQEIQRTIASAVVGARQAA